MSMYWLCIPVYLTLIRVGTLPRTLWTPPPPRIQRTPNRRHFERGRNYSCVLRLSPVILTYMMTPWTGSSVRIIGALWRKISAHRLISSERACYAGLWCFLFCLLNKLMHVQTVVLPVIWDVITLMWRHCNVSYVSSHGVRVKCCSPCHNFSVARVPWRPNRKWTNIPRVAKSISILCDIEE